MQKRTIRPAVLLWLLLLAVTAAGPVMAQNKAALKRGATANKVVSPSAPIHPRETILDVNNMTTWLQNDGFFPWIDAFSHVNGSFPKSTSGAVFAQGIVWGGIVRDGKTPSVRVNGSTYQTGLDPGKVLRDASGNVIGPDEIDLAKYHVWRVHRNWQTMDLTSSAAQFYGVQNSDVTADQIATVREQYEYDWNNWPAAMGAPYDDVDGNGSYDPTVDVPGYPGADQTLWIVTNDLRQGTAERSYGSPAIGIEYQLTIWGYDFPATSPLGNISFARARLIYTGTPTTPADARIDSMYVVQWADPDVGDYGDDYAGSDTTLSLGYAYNANTRDAAYDAFSLAPPAVGWDFLQGPINQEGDTLGMTAFVYFAAGSDISDPDLSEYSGTLQWYNLMRGLRPRPEYPAGDPFVNPLTGEASTFTLTGDPVSGEGWVDGQQLPPGDRRVVLATGPFTMMKGDTVDVVIGQVGALGTSNISSVSLLKYYDLFAQFSYDNNFVLPSPPPVPPVTVAELDEQVLINWSIEPNEVARVENFNSAGFRFEGYNVYQIPTPASSVSEGVKVATFDKANDISFVFDNVFDPVTGFVYEKPVLTMPNAGLQRFIAIDQDRLRNRPVANGVPLYFAVTSFSVLEGESDSPFRLLESTPVVITATPQPPKPGEGEGPAPTTPAELAHEGASTSAIEVAQIDPTRLVTGNYSLEFAYYNPYTNSGQPELSPADTLAEVPANLFEAVNYSEGHAIGTGDPFPVRWRLVRDGTPVSGWMPQIDPDGPISKAEAPIIDGVQVYVPFVIPQIASWSSSGTRWVTGVNWGGEQFFGGAAIGHHFFGSTLPLDQLAPVTLEFQGDNTSGPADGWASTGAVYIRGSGYAHAGTAYLPFAAYELQPDGSRRQVNVSIVEMDATCANGIWDMGLLTGNPDCSALGGREYIFVHKSDYDGGASYDDTNWGPAADVQYAVWPNQRGTHPYLEAPFTLSFNPAIANSPADQFTFQVAAPETGNAALIAEDVKKINVFPNPYLGYSALETSRFQKFVTFTHLPEQATIRIFNLSGTMVRELVHQNPTQFEQWDLTNQDGIPVASGLYIAHVDTDFGEKVLKIAIVTEEQILQRY